MLFRCFFLFLVFFNDVVHCTDASATVKKGGFVETSVEEDGITETTGTFQHIEKGFCTILSLRITFNNRFKLFFIFLKIVFDFTILCEIYCKLQATIMNIRNIDRIYHIVHTFCIEKSSLL